MLGRKDLRTIISWWKILHEEYVKANEEKETSDTAEKTSVKEESDLDEDDKIQKEIDDLQVNVRTKYNLYIIT